MRKSYLAAAAILAATFVGGWVAAVAFQSPEQRAAAASPPPPRPIVTAVTAGRLADQITARAEVAPRSRHGLSPSELPERATITSLEARRGEKIDAGDVPFTINGRPLFVLPGAFDFYRDLAPGLEGLDVTQLQNGLRRAGHPVPEYETGTFGAGTEQALRSLYAAAGFDPVLREREVDVTAPAGPRATPPPLPPPMAVLPVTEVAVVRQLPATLGTLPTVGSRLSSGQAVAVLETGALVARASVVVQAAVRLEPGMPVSLATDAGQTARGTVTSVSTVQAVRPGDPATAGNPLVLITPRRPLPPRWAGMNVLARITISLRSEKSLIVPTVAVSGGSDGEAAVFKERRGGGFVRVPVRELSTFAGRSAVEPLEPGALVEGDNVRVG
ncbi:MAG: hypothetical protein M3279_02045 [Actinomycetota bacterium]|nr:hypothetical protein [Actinomycetota bacterium]